MPQSDLNQQWRQLAPAWIYETRQGRNPTRAGLLDQPVLAACGDPRGLHILDSGCGEGRFCGLLLERGAGRVLRTRKISRLLTSKRPGARFIVANLHPIRSAVGGWQRTDDGAKQHVILDRYFDEGERTWPIMGLPVTNFHRTLVRAYRSAGFALADIVEPTMDAGTFTRYPELADELRVPNFVIFVLEKPASS